MGFLDFRRRSAIVLSLQQISSMASALPRAGWVVLYPSETAKRGWGMFGWLRRFFSSPGNAARAAAGSGDSQPNGNSNSPSGTAAPSGEAPGFLQEIQARLERARWHFKLRFIPSEAYKFWEVQPEERDEVNQARALRNRPPA